MLYILTYRFDLPLPLPAVTFGMMTREEADRKHPS